MLDKHSITEPLPQRTLFFFRIVLDLNRYSYTLLMGI
jgi:hypothetical protein